jgi:hypothetical protein
MNRPGDAEAETQAEIREDARSTPDDPTTGREELELELMEEDESDAGEHIGQQND